MNIVAFVLATVLFIGGIVLFGYGWDGTTFHVPVFVGGLLCIFASIAIPFHLLKRLDG